VNDIDTRPNLSSPAELQTDRFYLLVGASERQRRTWLEERGVRLSHPLDSRVLSTRQYRDRSFAGRQGPVEIVILDSDDRPFTTMFTEEDTEALKRAAIMNQRAAANGLIPTMAELLTAIATGSHLHTQRVVEYERSRK
jgi:hypothetical protein